MRRFMRGDCFVGRIDLLTLTLYLIIVGFVKTAGVLTNPGNNFKDRGPPGAPGDKNK
jgi:hypothetical protein